MWTIVISRAPALSTSPVSSGTAPALSGPGLSVQAAPLPRRKFLPDNAVADHSGARRTAIGDLHVEQASTSGTVLANKKDKPDEPGNADKQSGLVSDRSSNRHQTGPTCEPCDRTFASHWALVRHARTTHANDQEPVQCRTCNETFTRREALITHEYNAHRASRQYFECDICHRLFVCTFTLNRHRDLHISTSRYKCEFCGKDFSSRNYLRQHEKTHENKKSLQCSICDQTFAHGSHLSNHMKGHLNGREKPCTECNQTFISLRLLTKHLILEHGKGELYSCSICHAEFASKQTLQRHNHTKHTVTQGTTTDLKTNNRKSAVTPRNIYGEGREGNACSEVDKRKTCSGPEAMRIHNKPPEEEEGTSKLEGWSISSACEEEGTHSEPEEGDAGSEHTEEVPEDLKSRRDFPGKLTSRWTNIWTNRSKPVFPAPGTTRTGLSPARAVGPFFSSSRKL